MTRSKGPPTRGQGFTFFAPHHFYWGLIIMVWAFWDIFQGPPELAAFTEVWIWLRIGVGLWLCIDDIRQHLRQRQDASYHTLWHNAYWQFLRWARGRVPEGPKWNWLVWVLDWLASV